MFKKKMLIVAPLALFFIMGSSMRSCVLVVPQTGQTASFGDSDDGELQRGLPWPNPRFTDNEDGTVTDNLTDLVWLKEADCFVGKTWDEALDDSNNLKDGDCELSDGSVEGDWRLPNVRELLSLIHYGVHDPALPNTAGTAQWSEGDPFTGVQSNLYWSSTSSSSRTDLAWYMLVNDGEIVRQRKVNPFGVWPVRGVLTGVKKHANPGKRK